MPFKEQASSYGGCLDASVVSVLHATLLAKRVLFVNRVEGGVFEYLEELSDECWAVVELDAAAACPLGFLAIGCRLDADCGRPFSLHLLASKDCRLVFHGNIVDTVTDSLQIFCWKERLGRVDRVADPKRIIGHGLVGKSGCLDKFVNARVEVLDHADEVVARGRIHSRFGSSGKFSVALDEVLAGTSPQQLGIRLRYKKTIR